MSSISVWGSHWQSVSYRAHPVKTFLFRLPQSQQNKTTSRSFRNYEDLGFPWDKPLRTPPSLAPSTHSLMHWHCKLAWLQLTWGYVELSIHYWVCIHFWTWHSFTIKRVNFLKQGTYSAASQTGPLRKAFKEGTCFSTLLSQDGQVYWGSAPAHWQSFAPVSLLRASRSGTFSGDTFQVLFQELKKENFPSWTKT